MTASSTSESTPVVLCVDDESAVLRALTRTLELAGFTVHGAEDAHAGMKGVRDHAPTVVVSDFQMAGPDGVEFLRDVQAHDPAIQRIMLTGHADMALVEKAINEGGVQHFLTKPWDTEELVATIRTAHERPVLGRANERLLNLTREQNERLRVLAEDLESKVEERTDQVIRAKRAWEGTFDAIVDPLAVVGADLHLVRGNRAWADEAGLDVRTIPGEHYARFFGGEAPADCPVARTFESRASATAEVLTTDASRVYRMWTFFMDTGPDEAPLVVCHYKDVTDEKSMQRQLVQSEKLAAVGQLAGGVAHEINNPLSAIIAFTQLGMREVEDGSELHEFMSETEQAALRCKEIVQNLLTFSRAPQRGEVGPVDLNLVVERAAVLVGHQFQKAGCALIRDESDAPVMVHGNANLLMQVLVNLLANAVGAMDNGGTATVTTRLEAGGTAVLAVEDTGHGIPAEARQRVFEPFYTTKPEGQGTGLGLALSYGIVADHEGEIELESEVGKGTCFRVVLPALAE